MWAGLVKVYSLFWLVRGWRISPSPRLSAHIHPSEPFHHFAFHSFSFVCFSWIVNILLVICVLSSWCVQQAPLSNPAQSVHRAPLGKRVIVTQGCQSSIEGGKKSFIHEECKLYVLSEFTPKAQADISVFGKYRQVNGPAGFISLLGIPVVSPPHSQVLVCTAVTMSFHSCHVGDRKKPAEPGRQAPENLFLLLFFLLNFSLLCCRFAPCATE